MLDRDWTSLKSFNLRVKALSALMLASAFLDDDPDLEKLASLLISEALSVMLSDGCHATRQPDLHLDLLKSLLESQNRAFGADCEKRKC